MVTAEGKRVGRAGEGGKERRHVAIVLAWLTGLKRQLGGAERLPVQLGGAGRLQVRRQQGGRDQRGSWWQNQTVPAMTKMYHYNSEGTWSEGGRLYMVRGGELRGLQFAVVTMVSAWTGALGGRCLFRGKQLLGYSLGAGERQVDIT